MTAENARCLRRVLAFFVILVIARRRRHCSAFQQPAPGLEPLGPFVVVLAVLAADQVASEQGQPRVRCRAPGLTDHPRDQTEVLVLGIAEIQQGQRRGGCGSRAEVIPRAPGSLPLHAVRVHRVRLQPIDIGAMVMRAAVFAGERQRARPDASWQPYIRRIAGDHQFQPGSVNAGIGAPGHRKPGGRVLGGGGNDAVREAVGNIMHGTRRHLRIGFGSAVGRRRVNARGCDRCQQRVDRCAPGHHGVHSFRRNVRAISRQSNAATAWSSCNA